MEARRQLKEWRRARGLTQFGLSLTLDVTKDFIGMIERGERKPGLSLANLIKRETGIPQEDWDDPPVPDPAATTDQQQLPALPEGGTTPEG